MQEAKRKEVCQSTQQSVFCKGSEFCFFKFFCGRCVSGNVEAIFEIGDQYICFCRFFQPTLRCQSFWHMMENLLLYSAILAEAFCHIFQDNKMDVHLRI